MSLERFRTAVRVLTAAAVLVGRPLALGDEGKVESRDPAPKEVYKPKGKNLVPNPGFEKGDASGKFPVKWEPMPPNVQWIDEPGKDGKSNKVIYFKVPANVAQTTGQKYWSDYIEVKPNRSYIFSFDCKKKGGVGLKVWARGYMVHKGVRREIYRAPVHVHDAGKEWKRCGRREMFSTAHPSGREVKWIRFLLYAYGGGAGEAWWDNFHMEEVVTSPEDDL